MRDEEWVKVAMADDTLVVHLLLRLHQPRPTPPSPPSNKPYLHLNWTVRQRRSRSAPRASPTTPLSWSAATSASAATAAAAAEGYEESSRPTKPVESSRSKVGDQSETATTKRSRRKRTLAELKEEENLLLKERRHLNNELTSLRLTVEKQRATNESLTRMKNDLESQQTFKTATTSLVSRKAVFDPPQLVEALCHPSKSVLTQTVTDKFLDDDSPVFAANASSKQEISNQDASFVLPDLNLPVGEDINSNAIHGIS